MQRIPPRKSILSYFMPFFLLGTIVALFIYYLQNASVATWGLGYPVALNIETPEVSIMLNNKQDWQLVPKGVSESLYKGDKIKTSIKGEARLDFLKDSFLFLDNNTTISIENNEQEKSNSFENTQVKLINGRILASLNKIINIKSNYRIQLENIYLTARDGAIFILEEGILQVLEGKVKIMRYNNDEIVAETTVGVGQQLNFDLEEVGDFAELTALNSELYASDWVKKALGKEISNSPLTDNNITNLTTEVSPPNLDNLTVEKQATSKIIITNPMVNNVILINKEPLEIKGQLTAEAEKVIVNDYVLSKFKTGDKEWLFRANTKLGNLQKGDNIYNVVAKFTDGTEEKLSVKVNFDINNKLEISETEKLSPEEIEPKVEATIKEEDSKNETETKIDAVPTITSYDLTINNKLENGLIKTSTEPVILSGTVSTGVTKMVVNGYQLSKFKANDISWTYQAKVALGNLQSGLNTYEITAYFADGKTFSQSVKVEFSPVETPKTEPKAEENNITKTETTESPASENATPSKENTSEVNNTKTETPSVTNTSLSIISPAEGEKINYDPVIIRGTVPTGTAKIVIDDYTLRTFNKGDMQWKYTASQKYNNLIPGKENKYLITAYDENDNKIASVQFQFFSTVEKVEKSEE